MLEALKLRNKLNKSTASDAFLATAVVVAVEIQLDSNSAPPSKSNAKLQYNNSAKIKPKRSTGPIFHNHFMCKRVSVASMDLVINSAAIVKM